MTSSNTRVLVSQVYRDLKDTNTLQEEPDLIQHCISLLKKIN